MNMVDIIQKTDAELATMLEETRAQVAALAIETRTKQVPNVKQAHALKKTVARILTAQRARQLEAAVATPETAEPKEAGNG